MRARRNLVDLVQHRSGVDPGFDQPPCAVASRDSPGHRGVHILERGQQLFSRVAMKRSDSAR